MGFHKRNSAFTIIELLVVVSIISILSSIVMRSLNSARDKAVDATIKQGLIQMRNAYELVYSSNNSYTALIPTFNGNIGTLYVESRYSIDNPTDLLCSYTPTTNSYSCQIITKAGCGILYANDLMTSSKACEDLVSKTTFLRVGVTGSISSKPDVNNQFGILARYKSNTNYFCIRNNGKIIENLPSGNATDCLDINSVSYPW